MNSENSGSDRRDYRAGCPKGKMNMWDIVKISLHIVGATLAVALVERILNPL